MELSAEASAARERGDASGALSQLRQAVDLEEKAAQLVERNRESEPTRSILYLGAASLAFKSSQLDRAERLAGDALSGYPTRQTQADLLDLLEEIDYLRRQTEVLSSLGDSRLPTPDGARLGIKLRGPVIGFGQIPIGELLPRLEGIGKILDRFARRMLGQPYQASGPTPHEYSLYQPIVHAFNPGSFEVEIELAPRPNSQMSLPLLLPSSLEIVESAATCIEAVDRGDENAIVREINDDSYMKNFMVHVRELAPDGEQIDAVEVSTPRRLLALTRRQDQIGMPRISTVDALPLESVSVDRPRTLIGSLLMGDARQTDSQTVSIVQDNGSETELHVEEGLEEIVRNLFGFRVMVEVRYRGRSTILQDIRRAADEGQAIST